MTEIKKATLIYKMVRLNDPDFKLGAWGVRDCYGQARNRPFSHVIGVGGGQGELQGRVIWVGLDRKKISEAQRGPVWGFQKFLPVEGEFVPVPPRIAAVLYGNRYHRTPFLHVPGADPELDAEVSKLLALADGAPPSQWGICRKVTA